MKSKNAEFLKQGVIDQSRKMTPDQKLRLFIEHSRLMKKLHKAGEIRRESLRDHKVKNG